MNSKKIKQLMLAGVLTALATTGAQGSENISLSHQVVGSENNGLFQSISLALTVSNQGLDDLHSVKLSPRGSEFSAQTKSNAMNIGYLPSMGESIIHLTANTPIAEEYFRSSMPVFFVLRGKTNMGNDIELPLYSQGGEQ
jgi:hypothetical protein